MSEANRQPKIHFAALLGVEVDADMIPWWAPHYRALKLDSYTVFLHESPNERKNVGAESVLLDFGFAIRRVPENALRDFPVMPNCPDGVRRTLLKSFAESLPPRDFLVTADGDEIQHWQETPKEAVARGIEVVTGRLFDRFDDTLHQPVPGWTLEESFPGEHPDLHEYFKQEPLMQKKICMAPASFPVEYSGSHDFITVKGTHRNCFITGPIRILHYRWRASAIARVEGRYYWPAEEIAAMKRFFSVKD